MAQKSEPLAQSSRRIKGGVQRVGEHANLVLSYPKSGRTWLRYILHLAGDIKATYSHANTGTETQEIGSDRIEPDPFVAVADRVVFLHRNPIDTAVSFYFEVHHRRLGITKKGAAEVYLKLRREGKLPPKDLFAFLCHPSYGVLKVCRFNQIMKRHLEQQTAPHIEVTYENLKRDPVQGFGAIMAFLSGNPNRDVEKLVREASFDKMKSVEAPAAGRAGKKVIPGLKPGWFFTSNARKVRRGKVEGYRDYLSPEQCLILEGVVRDFSSNPDPYLTD